MAAGAFKIEKVIKGAFGRAGTFLTTRGVIHTPAFAVVGTKATVKAVTPSELKKIGVELVLANAFHLYLEPGVETVKEAGGLGRFMGWPGPTMTDSGGFQVFSLGAAFGRRMSKISGKGFGAEGSVSQPVGGYADELLGEGGQHSNILENVGMSVEESGRENRLVKVNEDGVEFRSPFDGSKHLFTPERSVEIQRGIGADIIFAFDECTSPDDSYEYQKEALKRTHQWARRCLAAFGSGGVSGQALFGIVQGGRFADLRRESAREIGSMNFDGFGIGGSFDKDDIASAVRVVNESLPPDRPRHLLGIGEPVDLVEAVESGCDFFDCVAPTRNGRTGTLYTRAGKINITNTKFTRDFTPVESDCVCYTCQNFTRAYLCHLFRAEEMLAATLASIHNIRFITDLMTRMRQAIIDGSFRGFKDDFVSSYNRG